MTKIKAAALSVLFLCGCATPYQMITGGGVVSDGGAHHTIYFSAMHGGVPVIDQCWMNGSGRLRCVEKPLRDALAETMQ